MPVKLTTVMPDALLRMLAWFSIFSVAFATFFYIPWKNDFEPYILQFGTVTAFSSYFLARLLRDKDIGLNCDTKHTHLVILLLISVGVALRTGWTYAIPPVQTSDMASYISAAQRLLDTGSYFYELKGQILHAWRPPGYPFLLAGFMAVFGNKWWVPLLINLISYVLTSVVIYKFTERIISNSATATVAVSIYTFWPASIIISGLALSETVSLLLFTLIAYSITVSVEEDSVGWAVAGGVIAGVATLVRPSVLVIPVLWLLYWIMLPQKTLRKLFLIGLSAMVFSLILSPWSYRNYEKLNAFIPVSTNGGDVLYRSNNPVADGSYKDAGEKDLSAFLYDEVLWNQTGSDWAKEWIKANPFDFAKLAIRKQAILLGDEKFGATWTLDKPFDRPHPLYNLVSVSCTTWWFIIWTIVFATLIARRKMLVNSASASFLIWMTLFYVVVHSVYESQDRYHFPAIGLLSILASLFVAPVRNSPSVARGSSGT